MGLSCRVAGVLVLLCAAVTAVFSQKDPCTLSDGQPGVCELLSACPAALVAAQRGERPQHCGFASGLDTVPIVCCPGPTSTPTEEPADVRGDLTCPPEGPDGLLQPPILTCEQLAEQFQREPLPSSGTGNVARRKCRESLQEVCALSPRRYTAVCPVGGEIASILEYPHMALLGYGKDKESIEYACGGSLISENFVLTAAHCRALNEEPVRWVLLGATNRTVTDVTEETRQLIAVQEIVVHPGYQPPKKYNDVALLRLAQPANVAPGRVRPACLHTDLDDDLIDQEAVATGWGATGFAEEGSEQLIKVNLTVRDLQFCKSNVQLPADAAPQGLLDSHMCAGGDDDRDTCQGDSGGPIQVPIRPNKRGCLFSIVGVVSFGPPCGLGKPGIYSKVAAFVPWIEDIVWPTGSDSCVRQVSFSNQNRTVPIPDSGPGTRARRMCRVFSGSFCKVDGLIASYMRPGASPDARCHHRYTPAAGTEVLFRYGNSPTVSLVYGENHLLNEEYGCSGVLIAPQFVVTAAHCAKLGCLPVKQVRFGKPHTCTYQHSLFDVSEVHVHPDFDPLLRYNDIALLKLDEPVEIAFYLPACLQTETDGDPGTSLRTEGWFVHGRWEDMTYDFAARNTSVLTRRQCEAALRPGVAADLTARLPRGLDPTHVCAGGLCDGDSYPGNPGSPLLFPMFNLNHTVAEFTQNLREPWFPVQRVVGVEAYSPPCGARLPDVFTSVSAFVPWIESVVWPDG